MPSSDPREQSTNPTPPTTIDASILGMNLAEVERYLQTVFADGDWIEFRGLNLERRSGRGVYRRMQTPFIFDDNLKEFFERYNQPQRALYVGANPRTSDYGMGEGGMAVDADCAIFRCLFADFDDATPDEAITRIAASGLPYPTMVIQSGRAAGTHVYWRLQEAITDRELWIRLQVSLNRTIGSDACIKNPSRIMRLPGSFNHVRGRECRILRLRGTQPNWEATGLQPAQGLLTGSDAFTTDADLCPDWSNLNASTTEFLSAVVMPEGNRNNMLFRAAVDFNGNNFPLQVAMTELVDRRAVARDGLPYNEASATVRRAYGREASPSYFPRAYPEGTDYAELDRMLNFVSDSMPENLDLTFPRTPRRWTVGPMPSYLLPGGAEAPSAQSQAVTPSTAEADSGPQTEAPPTTAHEGEVAIAHSELPSDVERGTSPAFDGRPVEVEDRPTIRNVTIRMVRDGNRTRFVETYRPPEAIVRDMIEALGGWPRRCSALGGLFGITRGNDTTRPFKPIKLRDEASFFAYLHARCNIHWAGGEVESTNGEPLNAVTKREFFEYCQRELGTPEYAGIGYFPHFPTMADFYYLPVNLPESDGSALEEFINKLNPATEMDRYFMLAALLTPGWGGEPGSRPMFVFSSDFGQGSGKTATVKAIGDVWGGAAPLDYEEDWATTTKRIMSGDDASARVFMFDNMKGRFSSSAVEAAVTAKRITGHMMYVGNVSRVNDATFFLTFNVPEFSRDIAQRSILIKCGRPKTNFSFEAWASEFIRENQLRLIADCLKILQRPPAPIDPQNTDRWSAWQHGVLARIPGIDPNLLAAEILARRPAVDADTEEGIEIARCMLGLLGDRAKGVASVEINARQMYLAMIRGGEWSADTSSRGARSDQTKCVNKARRALNTVGCLFNVRNENGLPKKVYTDEDGEPVTRSSSQCTVYSFDVARARFVCELTDTEDVSLPALPLSHRRADQPDI